MVNPQVTNPNDFKVVQFKNSTDFAFTPEMGCMFDSRPISGISGSAGIAAGESITLPYHIGRLLAQNLAKAVMVKGSPTIDTAGIPTGVPIWSAEKLEAVKNTFITELYSETKPTAMTETDRLMAKVDEYKKMVEKVLAAAPGIAAVITEPVVEKTGFQDKAEIIAELEKRGVVHDKRSTKATLEKLLV